MYMLRWHICICSAGIYVYAALVCICTTGMYMQRWYDVYAALVYMYMYGLQRGAAYALGAALHMRWARRCICAGRGAAYTLGAALGAATVTVRRWVLREQHAVTVWACRAVKNRLARQTRTGPSGAAAAFERPLGASCSAVFYE
jgi:hypothetical protein